MKYVNLIQLLDIILHSQVINYKMHILCYVGLKYYFQEK